MTSPRPGSIPGRLRRKIPPALLMLVDGRWFWTVLGLGLALFAIYGPIVGVPDHNGFRYLILPILSPWVPGFYYRLRPINPYSGYRGRWHNLAGMVGTDQTDPEARQLVELFQSAEGQAATTRSAVMVSVLIFVPMALECVALWDTLTWTFWSNGLLLSIAVSIIACWITLFTQVINWGIRTWAARLERESQLSRTRLRSVSSR